MGNTNKRMDIVDALRGFSLAGIVIVHVVENYIGAPFPEGVMEATHLGITDNIVDGFIFLFLRGKFFALFSFLFGLSFFIQMANVNDKESSFAGRFLWRLIILLVIGYLHSLFYRGDILTIYAFLGIFLIPFYKINNKWVLGITTLLFIGFGRYLVFGFYGNDNLFTPGPFDLNSPLIVDYFNTIKNGTLWQVFETNAIDGHLMKMDFQLGIFSRGYLTFGFFLLGLYVGRLQLFRNFMDQKKLVKNVLWGSVVLFVVSIGLIIGIFSQLGPEAKFDNWIAMFGLTALDLNNIG
ncbi:DUF418 domain-containing protein, partial [Eudoraea sp.]|uniref:DUF418 domain-containing protein n=1 Tax=Eudoraea sp. TaxID=1979955 RepID=UPI003C731429